jgi:type IV pilus assembly protein PilE
VGRKRGFTLIELLATMMVLAVLGAVALPSFTKAKAKAEKNQAIAYLRTIRTSMRMYYGKWKNYIVLADTAAIKSTLGAETRSANYTFAVNAPTAATFTATATGPSGTITLNQDGIWGGTATPLPPPD